MGWLKIIKVILKMYKIIDKTEITLKTSHEWNIYSNTVLDGSVVLSVRYRNHFPDIQFQNQAHIQNPHGTGKVLKTIWGAKGGWNLEHPSRPNFSFIFFLSPPPVGCPRRHNFFFVFYHCLRRRFLMRASKAPLLRRAMEIPPKAGVSRVFIIYISSRGVFVK